MLMMGASNRTKRIGFVLALLLFEAYALASVYSPMQLMAHLVSCALVAPFICWLYIARPLSQKTFDDSARFLFRLLYGIFIAGIILCLLRAESIGQQLGDWALVPVNALLAAACLVEPAAHPQQH